MPKRNKHNKPLPARWRFRYNAYYYRVPPGLEDLWDGKKEFRLGATLTEAYRVWSERLQRADEVKTIDQLLDRYALEVIPGKAYETQQSNYKSLTRLRPVFGHMPLITLKPSHAYRYLDLASTKHGNHTANRDFEVLSHAFSKAVEWGLVDFNPIKGQVRKLKVQRRERYVEDWEIIEVLKVASPMLRAYIALKLLTGLRRGDLLRLQVDDMKTDGLHVRPHKTEESSGVSLIIESCPELQEAFDSALAARSKTVVPWVFCTRYGAPYIDLEKGTASAFDTLWQRFMKKALADTGLKERFQEKDLRKKAGSDIADLFSASKFLGHSSPATTKKHYRLKPEKVKANVPEK